MGVGGGPGVQLYFRTFLVSTFLQNPGRLEQKCTLKMYTKNVRNFRNLQNMCFKC